MSGELVSLVPAPTADVRRREAAIDLLETWLAKARAGEIAEVVIFVRMATNWWGWGDSGCDDFAATIGRLELVKGEMIAEYNRAAAARNEGSPS